MAEQATPYGAAPDDRPIGWGDKAPVINKPIWASTTPRGATEVKKPASAAPSVRYPVITWSSSNAANGGIVPRSTLDSSAVSAAEQQLTLVAENAPIRTVYGRDRLGAQVANVVAHAGRWVVQAIWCEGEIDAVESVTFNDAALPASVSVTHYTGTAVQGVDATLAAAISGYADALPGIAYSVFSFPAGAVDGFPQIAAVIRGKRVFDPRIGLTDYSDNPALCLADFIERALGRTPDWATVEAAADACDALVGGAARRTIGLTLADVQDCGQWLDVLRAYAGCWVATEGAEVQLIPDRPRATDGTLTHAAGQIQTIRIRKRGRRNVPTAVRVRYIDNTVTPWRDAWVVADSGETPRRETEVSMPGIHSRSHAYREAVERLNKLRLSDLSAEIDTFDESLAWQVGDVLEVTHPYGLTAKPMRVLGVEGDLGRYRLALAEYDPAVYSDAVVAEATFPDTSLPSPADPPPVTGLAATEEVYQLENGNWSSRIRATWTEPAWTYLRRYVVELWAGGALVHAGSTEQTSYATPAVQEGIAYTLRVAVVSSIGAASAWSDASLTAAGKYLLPGNVPSLTGFEAGGEVRLAWEPAADIDIWRYEIRYGATGVTWAAATRLDRTDALRYVSKDVPAGTWDLLVCALDSVGQYSPTPARLNLVVTTDAAAYLVDTATYASPTLENMAAYRLGRTDAVTRYITEDDADFGTKFSAAMSTYNAPLAAYHASVTSRLTTEPWDFGQSLGGQWTGALEATAISGSIDEILQTSPDGSTYTDNALSVRTESRFARLRAEALTTSTLYVEIPAATVRVDAIPLEDACPVDTPVTSSATLPTTVTLDKVFAKFTTAPVITPLGTAARSYAVDALTPGSPTTFDVYLFNAAGAQVASDFLWSAKGV